MAYLLDANVFIEAKNRYYRLDFCPAFWDWLIERNVEGQVFSIQKVEEDIKKMADELAMWAAARGPTFFLKPDPAVLAALGPVSSWAKGQHYEDAAVSDFLDSSDYYLVAHALAHGHTVVSHEVSSNSLKNIKIPDACKGFGVECVLPFEMLSREQARFVLGR